MRVVSFALATFGLEERISGSGPKSRPSSRYRDHGSLRPRCLSESRRLSAAPNPMPSIVIDVSDPAAMDLWRTVARIAEALDGEQTRSGGRATPANDRLAVADRVGAPALCWRCKSFVPRSSL